MYQNPKGFLQETLTYISFQQNLQIKMIFYIKKKGPG